MIVRLLIIGRRGRLVSCRLANVTATAGHHHTAHGRRSKWRLLVKQRGRRAIWTGTAVLTTARFGREGRQWRRTAGTVAVDGRFQTDVHQVASSALFGAALRLAVRVDSQVIVAIVAAPLVGSAQSALLNLMGLLLLNTAGRVAQMLVNQRTVLRVGRTYWAGRRQLVHRCHRVYVLLTNWRHRFDAGRRRISVLVTCACLKKKII